MAARTLLREARGDLSRSQERKSMRTETPTIDVFEIARQKFFSSGDEAAPRLNERQDCSMAQS